VSASGWWRWVREVITFALGVAVIIDALTSATTPLSELIVGLVMVGVLPLERLLAVIGDRRR
jgi:hypothetical protein